jgi:inosine triphosphate pyrophosphatase
MWACDRLLISEEKNMKIGFVTNSKEKYEQATRAWDFKTMKLIHIKMADLIERQGSAEQVIRHKLEQSNQSIVGNYDRIFVEDTSLSIDGMDGFPGPYIKDFITNMGCLKFYELAKKVGDQSAGIFNLINMFFLNLCKYFLVMTCRIGYCFGNIMKQSISGAIVGYSFGNVIKRSISGTIVSPRGDNGYGFDSIFMPYEEKKTFAEMDVEMYDMYSPRCHCIRDLSRFLKIIECNESERFNN